MSNAGVVDAVGVRRIKCLESGSPNVILKGRKLAVVIVPIDRDDCHGKGVVHAYKAIELHDLVAVSVECFTEDQMRHCEKWCAEQQGRFEILSSMPEAMAGPISCPPPTDDLAGLQARVRSQLEELTRWARKHFGASPSAAA